MKKCLISCPACREIKEMKDMINVKERGEEMLSILNDIPYEKRQMFSFIWHELIVREALEKRKNVCDDCFEKNCNDIRQVMGVNKSDFIKYMNPQEAVKVERRREQSKKLSGPFSSKSIDKVKNK